MEEIRKSKFDPAKYNKLSLVKSHKNGNEIYSYETECDRCNGLGYIISHVENGKIVLVRPDDAVCYKCWGTKVMTRKIRVITDEEADAKAAKHKADAEAWKAACEAKRKELVEKHIADGYKLVDFKIAGWFFGRKEDKEYNCGKYYIIKKETEKAVCIEFIETLESDFYCDEWFPKKAIVKEN